MTLTNTQEATRIDGLIFDLDGTLLDRAVVFTRVAVEFYDEHLRNPTSLTRDEAVDMMVRWDGDGYNDREWMLAQWLSQWPDTSLDMGSLQAWYRSAMERQIDPEVEIIEFLARLNYLGVPWGIVTNGGTSQRGKCKAAGLEQIAPFIIVSGEVGYEKPDLRIFRDALTATRLSTPERLMFVGDNPVADIDGAKCFGMLAAWIRRGRQYPRGLLLPDYIIDHVLEVRNITNI